MGKMEKLKAEVKQAKHTVTVLSKEEKASIAKGAASLARAGAKQSAIESGNCKK